MPNRGARFYPSGQSGRLRKQFSYDSGVADLRHQCRALMPSYCGQTAVHGHCKSIERQPFNCAFARGAFACSIGPSWLHHPSRCSCADFSKALPAQASSSAPLARSALSADPTCLRPLIARLCAGLRVRQWQCSSFRCWQSDYFLTQWYLLQQACFMSLLDTGDTERIGVDTTTKSGSKAASIFDVSPQASIALRLAIPLSGVGP